MIEELPVFGKMEPCPDCFQEYEYCICELIDQILLKPEDKEESPVDVGYG